MITARSHPHPQLRRARRSVLVALILAALACGVGATAAAGPTPYGHFARSDTLYRVDLTFATPPEPILSFDNAFGLVWSMVEDVDGILWACDEGAITSAFPLRRIDPITGDVTTFPAFAPYELAVAPDGRLLAAVEWTNLYEIDRETGVFTLLFDLDLGDLGLSTVVSNGERLYVTGYPFPYYVEPSTLFTVDLETGIATKTPVVLPAGGIPVAGAAGPAGDLWFSARLVTDGVEHYEVWRVDPEAGSVDRFEVWGPDDPRPPLFQFGFDNLAIIDIETDVAALDVPTLDGTGLATMVLLLAVAGLVATRRRRRI